jgi:predicted  nucleic acid-binding Zn-ribbon protein
MASYGFPTLLQYSRLNSAIGDIKQRSEQTRVELVTGRIADLNAELAGSIGDAQLLRKAIDRMEANAKREAERREEMIAKMRKELNELENKK